jgi:multiple sugar transport system permease protein
MVSQKRHFILDIVIALGITLLVIFNIAPIAWGFLASLKTPDEIMTLTPTLFDFHATLENYAQVLQSGFMIGMRNSTLYALGAVLIGLAAGSLAAFGFDRFDFRGKSPLFMVIVASIPLAIGAAALLIPNYIFFARLGMINHWYTLPLIYSVHSLPIAIWIIKGSMEGIPKGLDEAAYIDGASSFTVFRLVILPLTKPAIGAAGLLLFIHAWNEFVAGSVMVDADQLKPVQPLIYAYVGFFGREWGQLTAAAILAVLPIFVIYTLFGRLLISGLTHGAVKG